MKKLALILLILISATISIMIACPKTKIIETKNICLGGDVEVKFQATWDPNDCDCPPDGTIHYDTSYDSATYYLYNQNDGSFFLIQPPVGKHTITMASRGTCSNGFVGWGPESASSEFNVVELLYDGHNPCGSNAATKEFSLPLNKGGTIEATVKTNPEGFAYTFKKEDGQEGIDATIESQGKITMGEKPGEFKFKVDINDFSDNNCSPGLGGHCCGNGKATFYIPKKLTIKSDCDSECTKEVTNTGEPELEMAVIFRKSENSIHIDDNIAGKKAEITFTIETDPAGFSNKFSVFAGNADAAEPNEDVGLDYSFDSAIAKKFAVKPKNQCPCSVKISAKVNAYSIEINKQNPETVKDNPVLGSGFEVEDTSNVGSRGDLTNNEFADEDHSKVTIKFDGPDSEYDAEVIVLEGDDCAKLLKQDGTEVTEITDSGIKEINCRVKGNQFSNSKDNFKVRAKITHKSVITAKCVDGFMKTIIETKTWEPPTVNNPRPVVTIDDVWFIDSERIFVFGTVKDWTGTFLRQKINNKDIEIDEVEVDLDISIKQCYKASWSNIIPIRKGSGSKFFATAVFQNDLSNFGSATAEVVLDQNSNGEIISAELGWSKSKPSNLEQLNTFTVECYDAISEFTDPSFPWKIKSSSGDSEDVESDSENSATPHFISKNYALMLDNFTNEKPQYVLKAKPGDRLINLLDSSDAKAAEYTYCKGVYIGLDEPETSITLSPGTEKTIDAMLGGDHGDTAKMTLKSLYATNDTMDTFELNYSRGSLEKLSIDYYKYFNNNNVDAYVWDGKDHTGQLKAEGGGELKIEFDGMLSEEPVLHLEILAPSLQSTDPASGPANIVWSQERSEYYDEPFKNNISQADLPEKPLVGVAITDVLPVIELDSSLKPADIQITSKIVNGKKIFLGEMPIKGVVRDVYANINLEAIINFVSTYNWNDAKNVMERITLNLEIKDEKISPAKPFGHTSKFQRTLKYELKHGKNYIRVKTGRNAVGASNDAYYLIEATENIVDILTGETELLIDQVKPLNPDQVIPWSPYFANLRNGMMTENEVPAKITILNVNMKTDHFYDKVSDGTNFKQNDGNNWSTSIFALLPFSGKKPNTDFDLPLGADLEANNGFITAKSASSIFVNANEIQSNKEEIFSVDLSIANFKEEDEADKGYFLVKSENVDDLDDECKKSNPVTIELKSSPIVKKLVDSKKGTLKLEVIKSKRTPEVSLMVKLANGKKITDGNIEITEANQQIKIFGLQSGIADLKISFSYEGCYTQDYIKFSIGSINFIKPYGDFKGKEDVVDSIKIFEPKALFANINIEQIPYSNEFIVSGTLKDWSGDIDLNGLFYNGTQIFSEIHFKLLSQLNIHGENESTEPIKSEANFSFKVQVPNEAKSNYTFDLAYRNKIGFISEYTVKIGFKRDKNQLITQLTRSEKFQYPSELEDIKPYLFRVYLFDTNNEYIDKVQISYSLNGLSGERSTIVESKPLLGSNYYSQRLVLIADGSRGNFNIDEMKNNLMIGWPGAKMEVNYKQQSNQNNTSISIAKGLLAVDKDKTKPIFSVISNTNRNLIDKNFTNNFYLVGGFIKNKCVADPEIKVFAEPLKDGLTSILLPKIKELIKEQTMVLKRQGNTPKDEDFYYYELESKNGIMAVHKKDYPIQTEIIPIFTLYGFIKFKASDYEVFTKVLRSDILEGDEKLDNMNTVFDYVSFANNKPKISNFNLKTVGEMDYPNGIATQRFSLDIVVEDSLSDLTANKDGRLAYVILGKNILKLDKDSLPAEPSESRPYPFRKAIFDEVILELKEGENYFLLRTAENILQRDDVLPIKITTKVVNKKLMVDKVIFENHSLDLSIVQNKFAFELAGGARLFQGQTKQILVNKKAIGLGVENSTVNYFSNNTYFDLYTSGYQIFTSFPAIKTKSAPVTAQEVLNQPYIWQTVGKPIELNTYATEGIPHHSVDFATINLQPTTVSREVLNDERKVAIGLFTPLFMKNDIEKFEDKAPYFKLSFNQKVELENPDAKLVLTLVGSNDISVFLDGKEVLNKNQRAFELDKTKFDSNGIYLSPFYVLAYEKGVSYIKAEFQRKSSYLNNNDFQIVAHDFIRLQNWQDDFIDLDIDSDNNNYYDIPERVAKEDNLEGDDKLPGKYIQVNSDDFDDDGIPDFADGFNADGIKGDKDDSSSGVKFIPLVLDVPKDIQLKDVTIEFKYQHIGKIDINREGEGSKLKPYSFTKEAESTLRIWKKNGGEIRDQNAVSDKNSGDFIPPNFVFEDLTALGFKGDQRSITLYIEGLEAKNPDGEEIKVIMKTLNGISLEDTVRVLVYDLRLGTDGDRDGTIDFANAIDQRIDFWLNDDIDVMTPNTKEDIIFNDAEIVEDDFFGTEKYTPFMVKDYQTPWIGQKLEWELLNLKLKTVEAGCLRDLEDFAKLKLGAVNKHLVNDKTEFYLKVRRPVESDMSIGLFNSFNETLDYLEIFNAGDKQIKEKKLFSININEQKLDKQKFNFNSEHFFLFEGEHFGKGQLVFGIKLNGKVLSETSIPIELRDIKSYYQNYTVGPNFASTQQINKNFRNDTPNEPVILYVHGWNMEGLDARWAETMYKRLYWQKFNGTVCLLDWRDLGATEYDNSEENAWRSSLALSVAIGDIRRSGLKGEITLFAHSQGNVVVGEYLRSFARPGDTQNYIATQAAISVHFYDGSLPELALNLDDVTQLDWKPKWLIDLILNKDSNKLKKKSFDTPNIYANFKNGTNNVPYMKDNLLKTNLVNFSNPFDWALKSWKVSNITRPNNFQGYHYHEGDKVLDTYLPDKGDAFMANVWDYPDEEAIKNRKVLSLDRADQRYEIFAQCSESRSLTLGHTQNVKGFSENFDLSTNVGYTDQHYSHSREFRSNIIDERVFWKKVFDILSNQ